jgi:thioredoxin 1
MKRTIEINQDNFEKEVLATNQTVLVDFWAEWCGPCKMIAPMLEEIAEEYAGRVKVAKVNVDENPVLAERHHVQSIPTLIFFANGLVRDQIVGLAGKQAIAFKLDQLLEFKSFKNGRSGEFATGTVTK